MNKKITIILILLSISLIGGCNLWELPGAKSKARQAAAEITDKRIELENLVQEWEEAQELAREKPTPENIEKADEIAAEAEAKAAAQAERVRRQEELLAAIKDSEEVVAETTDQAKDAVQYLPEPWRTGALMALTFGLTLVRGNRKAKVLADQARRDGYEEAEAVGISVVKSVDKVLTADQKKGIQQGMESKWLVDKAQGKI